MPEKTVFCFVVPSDVSQNDSSGSVVVMFQVYRKTVTGIQNTQNIVYHRRMWSNEITYPRLAAHQELAASHFNLFLS